MGFNDELLSQTPRIPIDSSSDGEENDDEAKEWEMSVMAINIRRLMETQTKDLEPLEQHYKVYKPSRGVPSTMCGLRHILTGCKAFAVCFQIMDSGKRELAAKLESLTHWNLFNVLEVTRSSLLKDCAVLEIPNQEPQKLKAVLPISNLEKVLNYCGQVFTAWDLLKDEEYVPMIIENFFVLENFDLNGSTQDLIKFNPLHHSHTESHSWDQISSLSRVLAQRYKVKFKYSLYTVSLGAILFKIQTGKDFSYLNGRVCEIDCDGAVEKLSSLTKMLLGGGSPKSVEVKQGLDWLRKLASVQYSDIERNIISCEEVVAGTSKIYESKRKHIVEKLLSNNSSSEVVTLKLFYSKYISGQHSLLSESLKDENSLQRSIRKHKERLARMEDKRVINARNEETHDRNEEKLMIEKKGASLLVSMPRFLGAIATIRHYVLHPTHQGLSRLS